LQHISPQLIDIHSQHETLDLFSEVFQMEVIDVLAGNSDLLKKYSKQLIDFNDISETITELKYKKESASKELDYNTFLYNELEEANLKGVQLNELEESYQTLNNSEAIQESLAHLIQLFSEDQYGTLETAKEGRVALSKLRGFSSEYEKLWNRLNSVIIELEDIAEEFHQSSSRIEADPKRLFEINEMLQLIYKLQQKHSTESIAGLLEIQNNLESKIDITNNLDEQIASLEIGQANLEKEILNLSDKIHIKRIAVIPTLKKKLKVFLIDLGLPNAQFKFDISRTTYFRKNGTDSLQLLFTANKGLDFAPLKKVASGGELSRIMLAIKAVLAQYKHLPTLIFDEIDSGISGEIAYKMAAILDTMSQDMQLLCITHLPQIAAKGSSHIKIFKEDIDNRTVTGLKL